MASAQTILTAGNDLQGQGRIVELELLREILIALNPAAHTTVATLLESGKDFLLPEGQQAMIELELLREIVDNTA